MSKTIEQTAFMRTSLILIQMLLFLGSSGCSQNRSYLTEREKSWNPYKKGQMLIFRRDDGRFDSLEISRVADNQFPDGVGALQNERMRIFATRTIKSVSNQSIEILYVYSKAPSYPSKIDFKISLGDGKFWATPFHINDLDGYKIDFLETSAKTYNDVIKITDNSNQLLKNDDIIRIYWSKSAGYVKCETKSVGTWELVSVIEPQK